MFQELAHKHKWHTDSGDSLYEIACEHLRRVYTSLAEKVCKLYAVGCLPQLAWPYTCTYLGQFLCASTNVQYDPCLVSNCALVRNQYQKPGWLLASYKVVMSEYKLGTRLSLLCPHCMCCGQYGEEDGRVDKVSSCCSTCLKLFDLQYVLYVHAHWLQLAHRCSEKTVIITDENCNCVNPLIIVAFPHDNLT